MIVIDYLQLLTSSGGKNKDNRVQELSEITRGLKMLAKEFDVPVIALSQLSRSVEMRDDKRPQLSDLRESGSIEQDADIVMFTYREEYYLANRDPSYRLSNTPNEKSVDSWQNRMEKAKGKADIIIGKNRHGKTDTIKVAFLAEFSLFDNLNEMANRGAIQFAEENIPSAPTMDDATPIDLSEIPDDMG